MRAGAKRAHGRERDTRETRVPPQTGGRRHGWNETRWRDHGKDADERNFGNAGGEARSPAGHDAS